MSSRDRLVCHAFSHLLVRLVVVDSLFHDCADHQLRSAGDRGGRHRRGRRRRRVCAGRSGHPPARRQWRWRRWRRCGRRPVSHGVQSAPGWGTSPWASTKMFLCAPQASGRTQVDLCVWPSPRAVRVWSRHNRMTTLAPDPLPTACDHSQRFGDPSADPGGLSVAAVRVAALARRWRGRPRSGCRREAQHVVSQPCHVVSDGAPYLLRPYGDGESACKRDSVHDVNRAMTIHLCGLPEGCPKGQTSRPSPLLGLAPNGVYQAVPVA